MLLKSAAIFILICISFTLSAQQKVILQLRPQFNGQNISEGRTFYDGHSKDSLRIDMLEFYVSGITFLRHDSVVEKVKDCYHLVDISDTSTLRITCTTSKNITYDAVRFNIGIDSVTNVSGVMGGDLDPTKGMYWAWQSGYINFRIEGVSPKCKTRLSRFQFHLGGYMSPNASMQTVTIKANNGNAIDLPMNFNAFFNALDLSKENQIMTPGADAVRLSSLIPSMFIQQK